MSKRDTHLYLEDIRLAIERIEEYTKGMSFEKFLRDAKTIDAVVRNIEVIGEAAQHVPNELQTKYPEIPWKLIAGTRNKTIHEYFGVDVEIVWKTVEEDIPKLKQQIITMLQTS